VNTSPNWRELEKRILKVIKTGVRPVAVAFLDAAPEGVKKFEGTQPSGCSFWRIAAEGRTFYTIPENHFNCAVGAYTHTIELSPAREKVTEQTLKMMFDVGYVKPEEIPRIPRLAKSPKAIVYSPLADAPVDPDVVLFALRPAAAMLFCRRRRDARELAPVRLRWDVRRAGRCPLRCNSARLRAWDASGTGFRRDWMRMKCM